MTYLSIIASGLVICYLMFKSENKNTVKEMLDKEKEAWVNQLINNIQDKEDELA
jgi:hypothetical protein